MNKTAKRKSPPYIRNVYSWLYFKPFVYNILDNSIIQNILTFGYHNTLIEELKKEIAPHSKILQIGVTLGSQIEKTYHAVGTFGTYSIVDILPHQLENCQEKHLEQKINFIHADASKTIKG